MRTAFVLLLALLWTAPALAEDQRARQAFQKGMVQFNLQHYEEALRLFEAAYEERQDPAFIFNIAQCQRQLARYEAAAKSYRIYLSNAPNAPNRADVEKRIADMDAAAELQRKAATTTTTTTAVHEASTAAPATPSLTAVAPEPARKKWYRSPLGWSLAAGGVACVVVGAAGIGLGVGERNQALAATTQPAFDQHHGSSIRDQQWGWPLFGVGAALVVTSAALLAVRAVHR